MTVTLKSRSESSAWALMWLLLAVVVLLALARSVAADPPMNVVAILSADADAYQRAMDGFEAFCDGGDLQIVKTYNMNGNFDTGRQMLSEIQTQIRPDLVFVVGVWALELITQEKPDVPVVYAMVLNPPSIIGPDAVNITGASMNVSVEQSLRLLKDLSPKIRRVGTVYTQALTGYLIDEARGVVQTLGLELVAKEIRSAKEAIAALKSLQRERVDALWVVPDKTILDPNVIKQMLLLSYRKKIPLMGLSERQAKMGTLLAATFASIEDMGMQAGELAVRLLNRGTSKSEIPTYTTVRKLNIFVNLKAARKLDIEIPEILSKTQVVNLNGNEDTSIYVTVIN